MNRGLLFLSALLTSSVFVAGCGGGSHSSNKSKGTGVLSVTLNGDAGSADGPIGTTQTVVIYRNDGTEVDKKSVDLSSGTKQLDFTGIPSGTMHLHVGLAATSGGAEAGAVDTTFEGGTAAAPVVVKMRQAVSGVVVVPSVATVNVGATKPLYAAARADDGSYVFTAANGWSWTSDSVGLATVSSTGVVSGAAAGTASVTATHLSSGAHASSTMNVLTDGVSRGKWTIMVYMDAANDLYSFAPDNINQMESIVKNSDVRFVVQWKQVKGIGGNTNPLFSGTRRYLVTPDSTSAIKSTMVQNLGSGVDMAGTGALRDFVTWSKTKYPADHYALVLWSHGGGWYSTKAGALALQKRAIIYDEETDNYLAFPDVRSALDPASLDLLAYDACLMQSAESYLEFADRTSVIVGTEDNTPGPGYPYQLMFEPFVDTPDTATSTLAAGMVSTFVNYYRNYSGVDWPIQMSALDTSKAATVAAALDGFGTALLNEATTVGPTVRTVRTATTRIEPGDGYYYYDLNQLSTNFAAQTSLSSNIVSAAGNLNAAVQSAVIANAAGNGSTAAPNFNGMSIEFGRSTAFASYASGYAKLQLSGLTHWNEFLASASANP